MWRAISDADQPPHRRVTAKGPQQSQFMTQKVLVQQESMQCLGTG